MLAPASGLNTPCASAFTCRSRDGLTTTELNPQQMDRVFQLVSSVSYPQIVVPRSLSSYQVFILRSNSYPLSLILRSYSYPHIEFLSSDGIFILRFATSGPQKRGLAGPMPSSRCQGGTTDSQVQGCEREGAGRRTWGAMSAPVVRSARLVTEMRELEARCLW